MTEQVAIVTEDEVKKEEIIEADPLQEIKQEIDANPEAIILCETKDHNPNYLSIVYANTRFYEIFGIKPFNLIGKSYDFLFSDLDLDYSSEDQLEYVRLIKAVKDEHQCSVIVSISNHQPQPHKIRFKVTYAPTDFLDEQGHKHSFFIFEKFELDETKSQEGEGPSTHLGKSTNITLLKNLERTLHNERLLREVGALIISDLPIREIAQKIAKILCEHLKADRCLLHDYRNAQTNFIAEFCEDAVVPMLRENDPSSLVTLGKYINFQNHFFQRHGTKTKMTWLVAIEDVESDRNFSNVSDICEQYAIDSLIAVTTTFNGKVNGGLYIHQSGNRSWMADELELVEMIAEQFSIAIDRSESIDRVMFANHALMEKTAQLKEALQHEQDMRKMQNEFVALVSHEFKTPLQIIDSTRELMTRRIKNHNIVDETLEKGLERIKNGIQRMNGLIHSTLNLAKMESGDGKIKLEKEVFDLQKFIYDIIEKNSNLAVNKNIKIITKIDALPKEFYADSKLLDHSFTNIVSNAIKYSKPNSTIKILAKANDAKVAIRFVDQGMGIPKDDLGNIGQKFYRAKNTLAVAGTGIGLYLTKHFIELHGGDVLIESEVNVGTSVTVTLPKTSQTLTPL